MPALSPSLVAAVARALAAIDHARAVTELTPAGPRRQRALQLIVASEQLLEEARGKADADPASARDIADHARSLAWAARALATGSDDE